VTGKIGHGMYVSAAAHAGVVLVLLLGLAAPRAFPEQPPDAIEVEVLTPQEAAKETQPPSAGRDLQQQSGPEKSEQQPREQEASKQEAAKQEQRPEDVSPVPPPGASMPAAAAAPPSPSPSPPPPPEPAPNTTFSAFDTAALASLYNLRLPTDGFDAPATETAKLTGEQSAAFRAQLRRCWRQPAGVPASSRARVVIRVSFTPEGTLAAEPSLVEASASRDGPAIYKAAVQALSQCAPYLMLPRERYREWRVLDVPFTSKDLAGG